jgi:hypothetical protein
MPDLATHVVQCVWPIVDDSYTTSQILAQAMDELDELAEQAHALVVGPPVWRIEPATSVPGWTAYGGDVLVLYAAAQPQERERPWRRRSDVDGVKVARACEGEPLRLGTAEKRAAVDALSGLPAAEAGLRLGLSAEAVERRRCREVAA